MAQRPKQKETAAHPHILNLDELARLEPIRGIGTAPQRLIREIERAGQHRVKVEAIEIAARGTSRAAAAGTGDAFRPRWVDLDYLPKVRPHRFFVPHLSNAPTRGFPHQLGMQTLMQESLTYSWPWRTIGKVQTGPATDFTSITGTGTGVIVGPNLMLTASHVAPWNGGWMRFIPAYRDGIGDPRFGSSYVNRFRGIRAQSSPNGYDYVICRLSTPIGNNTGWMGWQVWGSEEPYYDGTWFMNGYPGTFFGGERLAVEFPISIDDIDNDDPGRELEFGFYPVGGWSGGPFWGYIGGDPRVIGVVSGWEYDGFDPLRTVIAAGGKLAELIRYGWDNWV
jgi:hypothetical protein